MVNHHFQEKTPLFKIAVFPLTGAWMCNNRNIPYPTMRQPSMEQIVSSQPPILQMKGISKRFPGVLALNQVDFSVRAGEIHSLIGQNGAGKSTLMKILAGVYSADEGTIEVDGQPVRFHHPRDSLKKGIVTVYQELSLLTNLTVAENIFLGREPGRRLVIDNRTIQARSMEILESLGIHDIDINTKVANIPLAQRQQVEIAKALSHELKILVLDEPTAPLTSEDTQHLFDILNRLQQKGIAIIFITHRLKEVITYSDHGTILRNGSLVGTVDIREVDENKIIEMMIGQELESFFRPKGAGGVKKEETILEVENLSVGSRVKNVSFKINRGEIIGVTGLLGAGQNELGRALFGIQEQVSGTIRRGGVAVKIKSPQDAVSQGLCLLTENRKDEGLVLEMSVKENISLPSLAMFRRTAFFPFINNRQETTTAEEFIKKVNIILRSPNARIRTLSGGNQQKAIVARWLLKNLEVLVFIEPTRGIDVGAKAEIYRLLSAMAAEGRAIIVISTDHIEVMGVSDRIFVMYQGRLTKVFNRFEANEELLLSEIQGGSHHE
jgi:ribose transport system ATP-binding protein